MTPLLPSIPSYDWWDELQEERVEAGRLKQLEQKID